MVACKATAKKIPKKWLFALADTYSLIYDIATNLVIFDHTASTTITVPHTSLIGTNGNSSCERLVPMKEYCTGSLIGTNGNSCERPVPMKEYCTGSLISTNGISYESFCSLQSYSWWPSTNVAVTFTSMYTKECFSSFLHCETSIK
jgi:hypothetical protein